jgi:DNA-binding NarL/FixJ family response regulator
MRILVVDDHKLFAEAVQMALERLGNEVMVATSGAEAVETAERSSPDVVLLDIGLPDRSGFAVGQEILERLPSARIVVVTSLDDQRTLQEVIRLGFHGFLTKDTRLPLLVRAIGDAADGQLSIPHRLAARARYDGDRDADLLASQLTPREREVLALLTSGASSPEIARTLAVSPNTVRTHVQSILAKLQVHSRLEAVAFATRHKVLPAPSSVRFLA